MLPDWTLYLLHLAFWSSFIFTLLVTRRLGKREEKRSPGAKTSRSQVTAPKSRVLVAVHAVAFSVTYFGLGATVIPRRVPVWFVGQQVVGAVLILGAAAIACSAVAFFHSWRLRAKVTEGHVLATGGPFAYVRHPIYLSLNLLALGTAIWVPNGFVWLGFLLMVVGSELRARSEERILAKAFGASYNSYCAQTRRYIPGIY